MGSHQQYPFQLIEPKSQKAWEHQQIFRAWNPGDEIPTDHPFAQRHGISGRATADRLPPKFYILDMFPYPSGAGLHVGHPEGYTATDILSRYCRAKGFNVLHPMGWDAFGLPAEQYAIKTGQHPRITTNENIEVFKRQIKALGFSYDWSREVDTSDSHYFRWTQWIFLKMYNSWFNPETNQAEPISTLKYPAECVTEVQKRACRDSKRLAFVADAPVNWSPDLGTVLANEEIEEWTSKGFTVVRRPMRQWMLRITAYAERLLRDLDTIEWSDSLKEMQRNWIGRSEGAEVKFSVANDQGSATQTDPLNIENCITVFTTRPDTLFGATYLVLAPELTLVNKITTPAQRTAVESYKAEVVKKSDLERTELAKDKTGVPTGAYAINPVNGQRIPIWIADYVLASYGTGAIMAVPAHDTRDFEFAEKFSLPIVQVVQPPEGKDWHGYVDDGISVNSANADISLNGQRTEEAKRNITAWLESKALGKTTINYKIRDWIFSRQRYWGEPFPIVWKRDTSGNLYHEALPESALPLVPPPLDDYKPLPGGEPPLTRANDWVNLPNGSQRETNTMPQWAGSSWYYLRYLDAQNTQRLVGEEAERYWMGFAAVLCDSGNESALPQSKVTPGVDLYVGGTEHAVLHLIYARFWHKLLYDLGHVSTPEPFFKLVNQGLILGEDGQKMSKSRGNVVNPDDILKDYGADAFRLYEMFMGPLQDTKPWNTKGVEGVYRFLGRVWRLFVDERSEPEFEQNWTGDQAHAADFLNRIKLNSAIQNTPPTTTQLKSIHLCIKKVTEDLDGLRFNTAISAMMIFVNDAITWEVKPTSVLANFLQLLAPFAPHLSEELWAKVHSSFGIHTPSLSYAPWPKFDPSVLIEDIIEIPVSVNGKFRDVIRVKVDATQTEVEAVAKESDKVRPFLDGKVIKKIIVVPRKMVNIVMT